MKYCTKCGAQMEDNDFACSRCGFSGQSAPNTPPNQGYNPNNQGYNPNNQGGYNPNYQQNPYDAPSTGYGVLGCLFPIVGLIIYAVENSKSPLKAKSALKGALWEIGIFVGLYIIIFVIISGAVFSSFY